MSSNRERYTAARDALLLDITASLKEDPHFLAAWLAGSFGRGEQTWSSDLDLHVVVADDYCVHLCSPDSSSGAVPAPERLALFQRFGTPTIIYESHSINQFGGTFSVVYYGESAQHIDWMLIPQSKAHQEPQTLMLFDKVGIPEPPKQIPLTREQAVKAASDAVGFFWMIAAGAGKEAIEGDMIHFHILLDWLGESIRKVKYALQLREAPFMRNWPKICYTTDERVASLRELCDSMEALMPAVAEFGGNVPIEPRVVVEQFLALIEEQ